MGLAAVDHLEKGGRRLPGPRRAIEVDVAFGRRETEKNLERIFEEAERTGAVLFLKGADALFGKRTEVNDSYDRHGNVEVSYLLERMVAFHVLAILATNRRSGIDDAFFRRIRHVAQFTSPGGGR